MDAFVDPRTKLVPAVKERPARRTAETGALDELHRLCREGRIYEVERWIQAGQPLQLADGTRPRPSRWRSALEIALEAGNHALLLLLLCNGYDPNRERHSPLDLALRARRFDLLDLLLAWGADPQRVDPTDLFDTYASGLFERFRALGVDLCASHALAETLAYHPSNKPLFGYAKRHREQDPKIQAELDIALAEHARSGGEKGVSLCLWAGADPHAPVPDLRYGDDAGYDDEEDEEDRFIGFSAVHEACHRGHVEIVKRLGPDPALDNFDELYRGTSSSAVIELLAQSALPQDVAGAIQYQLWWLSFDLGCRAWQTLSALRSLFEVGARWNDSTIKEIAGLRRSLLKTSDQTFVELMKLLTTDDYSSQEILKELARTPAMRARMRMVGFIPASSDDPTRYSRLRPTRSREVLRKCGVNLPKPAKPKPPLPHTVQIGPRRQNGRKLQLDRATIFKRVWSEPISTLAADWGLSGTGLSKACRRLKIPVPPRGYWAKVQAGQRVRRPRLPRLPEGAAEEIVIYIPE